MGLGGDNFDSISGYGLNSAGTGVSSSFPSGGGWSPEGGWGKLAGGVIGGIASLFGGNAENNAYQTAATADRTAIAQNNNIYGQGLKYLQPYQDAGTQALGQYQTALAKLQDTAGFINHLMQGYQTSAPAQYLMQQNQIAADNAAAASGNLGTVAQQQAVMGLNQGISSEYLTNYLQNVLGVNSGYLQGLAGLAGQGFNAGNAMNQNRENLAAQNTQLQTNAGQMQAQGQMGQAGGIGGAVQ